VCAGLIYVPRLFEEACKEKERQTHTYTHTHTHMHTHAHALAHAHTHTHTHTHPLTPAQGQCMYHTCSKRRVKRVKWVFCRFATAMQDAIRMKRCVSLATTCKLVRVAVCCSVWQHMLQCVAGCCSVLLGVTQNYMRVGPCCSGLQCVAVGLGVLRCFAVWYTVLRCVTVCCSVLQCVAVCCSVAQVITCKLALVAVSCKGLQQLAVCCSVLQRGAVCCNLLQCVMSDHM